MCTECFSKKEILFLQEFLLEKYNLKTSLQKRLNDKKVFVGYRLYFSYKNENIELLHSLVLPYIHPIIIYKLGIK